MSKSHARRFPGLVARALRYIGPETSFDQGKQARVRGRKLLRDFLWAMASEVGSGGLDWAFATLKLQAAAPGLAAGTFLKLLLRDNNSSPMFAVP